MQKYFSIYLDLIRFLAAMGVFIGHLMNFPISGHVIWWRLGNYSPMCVTLFFVLSGYVIAYVTSARENTGKLYFISRFSRLYSVTVIALLLTFFFDHFGQLFDPGLYEIKKINAFLWEPITFTGYWSTLLFINEFQIFDFKGTAPGTNGPFWSLSFEVAYYVIAGLLLFMRKSWAIPLAILILALGGNTITALFPTWLLGYLLYKTAAIPTGNFQVPEVVKKTITLILFLGTALALIILPYVITSELLPVVNFGLDFPWGVKPFYKNNILADYVIALTFGLHLLAARQLPQFCSKALVYFEKPIRWLGSITFPLYCIHNPAFGFFKSISPWQTDDPLNAIFIGASTLILVAFITPLCEWLKQFLRKALTRATHSPYPV